MQEPEAREPPPIPPTELEIPREEDLPDEREQVEQARHVSTAVAEQEFEPEQTAAAQASQGGHRAVVQYDYEKAEDNEIELLEGDLVTDIDMIDEGWWMGTNKNGERGLFPCNYVELVEDDEAAGDAAEPPPPAPAASRPAAPAAAPAGPTATALYDYEAGEDNGEHPGLTKRLPGVHLLTPRRAEISFPEDAIITDLEFPDEDWWAGEYNGKKGLFPANYVQLNE